MLSTPCPVRVVKDGRIKALKPMNKPKKVRGNMMQDNYDDAPT